MDLIRVKKLSVHILPEANPPRTLLVDADGEEVLRLRGGVTGHAQKVAERLALCWNACAAFTTEELQQSPLLAIALPQEIASEMSLPFDAQFNEWLDGVRGYIIDGMSAEAKSAARTYAAEDSLLEQ